MEKESPEQIDPMTQYRVEQVDQQIAVMLHADEALAA
jgi:hypothetical protein